MLQFTKEVDYSIQLLESLNNLKGDQLLSLRKFSKETGISFLFLQRIAKKLREAGLVESTKGSCGGYRLSKSLKGVDLKTVVEIIEGEYAVANCLKEGCTCSRKGKCISEKVFKVVNKKLVKILESIKLGEIFK